MSPIRASHYALLALMPALIAACSEPARDTYQGYIEGEFVNLASSQGGRLEKLDVARGQQVAADAPLFVLESADETAGVQQAARQLSAAEAQLADIRVGKRPQEIDVTRAQLVQAEANARKAALQLTRDEGQLRIGGIAQAQLDESRAQAEATAAQVRQLRSQLAVDALPSRSEQIRAQSAQVDAARAALAQAQWRLDQKTVAAPAAGLVYDTLFRRGEWVAAGNAVVRMLPPENVKVRFFVPQGVVGSIAPGRALTIRCDGCEAPVDARVTFISNEAEFTPPVIYSNENRAKLVFMIEARPTPADAPRLRPGQPVEVVLK
ncbi:HlyD family secretion protein [Uliginosibacterium sp. sgz301328]|uniref:HlyD family secretion protein n=1 Tax=Uliginosibacterium sp. sgz301328 TaxID=3243764 RepID=UPI00359CBF3B